MGVWFEAAMDLQHFNRFGFALGGLRKGHPEDSVLELCTDGVRFHVLRERNGSAERCGGFDVCVRVSPDGCEDEAFLAEFEFDVLPADARSRFRCLRARLRGRGRARQESGGLGLIPGVGKPPRSRRRGSEAIGRRVS